MKIQCTMAELPKDNVKVLVSGNYLQVAYDFVRIEQKSEDSNGMHMMLENSCQGEYIELRGGIRSYDAIVDAIIEDKYPSDKMDAIRLNFELAQNSAVASISWDDSKREEYIAEYKEMQEWRIHAKEIARKAVELINANV
nr:MAG TPA: hypothetical protein [Bacteriophage sp.]